MKTRLSLGSAINLGLGKGSQIVPPTTLYIMLGEDCVNNCAFCTQAIRNPASREHLSRVIWPEFEWGHVLEALGSIREIPFSRACIQTLSYPGMMKELLTIIEDMRVYDIPISAAVGPLEKKQLEELEEVGLDRVGIALDAANPSVFENIKGAMVGNPYRWESHLGALESAAGVFPGRTTTHLMVGLGESDMDLVNMMFWCRTRGITCGLFSYTPFPGTRVVGKAPPLERYRIIQACRELIFHQDAEPDDFSFKDGKLVGLPGSSEIESDAFRTSGCPGCNRPFYNESVSGPRYNHPAPLDNEQKAEALDMVRAYLGKSEE